MRASALGLVLVCSGAVVAGIGRRALRGAAHSFVHSIDALPDWSASAASIRSEGADTVAADLVFARENPHVSAKVGELRLTDLAGGADGGFTATEIALAHAEVAAESLTYSVPAASLKDVKGPSVAGLTIDPHHLMTSIAEVYGIAARTEFSALTIPDMSSVQTQPGMGGDPPTTVRVDYRNLAGRELKDGVLAGSEVGPIEFHAQSQDGDVGLTLRSAIVERLDLGALAHVLDPAQYQNRRGDQILAASPFQGRVFRPDGKRPQRCDRPSRRHLGGDRRCAPAGKALHGGLGPHSRSERAERRQVRSGARGLAGHVRRCRTRDHAPRWLLRRRAGRGSVAVARLALRHRLVQPGDRQLHSEEAARPGPGGFRGARFFELAGLVFPDLQALMRFAALENDASSEEHANIIRSTFAALPRLAHVGLSGLAGGQTETSAVTLAGFSLDFRDWNDFYAQATDLRLDDLENSARADGAQPGSGQNDGRTRLRSAGARSGLHGPLAPGPGSDDATLTVTAKDAADMEVSYSLTGLTTDWILRSISAAGKTGGSEAAAMAVMGEIGLKSAKLKLTDRSLLDRGFTFAAKKQGLSVSGPAYRQQMRGALPFLLSAAVPAEISKLLSAPLQAFLGGGQSLVAEIAPAAPVPLPEIAALAQSDPKALKDRLNLTVRSEPAAQ